MTYTLAAALILTIAGFLVLLDRKDGRAKLERDADRAERADLLQRIQAPQLAVIDHAQRDAEDDPMPVTDDEGLTDEEREAIERLERMEAGNAPWMVTG